MFLGSCGVYQDGKVPYHATRARSSSTGARVARRAASSLGTPHTHVGGRRPSFHVVKEITYAQFFQKVFMATLENNTEDLLETMHDYPLEQLMQLKEERAALEGNADKDFSINPILRNNPKVLLMNAEKADSILASAIARKKTELLYFHIQKYIFHNQFKDLFLLMQGISLENPFAAEVYRLAGRLCLEKNATQPFLQILRMAPKGEIKKKLLQMYRKWDNVTVGVEKERFVRERRRSEAEAQQHHCLIS